MQGSRAVHLVGALALAAGLVLALPAMANVVLIGQVSPPDAGGCNSCAQFQLKTESGQPSYKVPKGKWELKAWSAQGGGSADGGARLLVFRPTATPGRFQLIGRSHKATVPADGSPFFSTQIQVKGGDRLGVATVDNLPSGHAGNGGDQAQALTCNPQGVGQKVGAGTACPLTDFPQSLTNVEAKLRPR